MSDEIRATIHLYPREIVYWNDPRHPRFIERDRIRKESDMITDQPPPTPQPNATAVWDLVIADVAKHRSAVDDVAERRSDLPGPGAVIDAVLTDMRERDRIGRERYGMPLTTNNGRDYLVDAYQEALDMLVYLRASIEERSATLMQSAMKTYAIAITVALSLRTLILMRDLASR